MKLVSAEKWPCNKDQKILLLLFVQRARELLLHTTSVVNKPRFSSAFTVTKELHALLVQHKKLPHTSTKVQVELLLDELRVSLRHDEVAKEFIGKRLSHVEGIFSDAGDINQQIEAAALLRTRITKYEYITECARRIAEIVAGGSKEKDRLISLVECSISAILDAGYPAQTVYHLLNITFLDREEKCLVSGADTIKIFFSFFDLRLHKYSVCFGLTEFTEQAEKLFSSPRYKIARRGSDAFNSILAKFPEKNKRFFDQHGVVDAVILVEDLQALDPQSARSIEETQLRFISDVIKLKSHRHKFSIRNEALVLREDKGQVVNSNKPKKPVLRVPYDSQITEDDVSGLMNRVSGLHRDSMTRLVRAVQLHSTALSADEIESQLLNIWIAFETLFVHKGHSSKIDEVIECATPYIIYAWLRYQLAELWEAIAQHHSKLWDETLGQTEYAKSLPPQGLLLAMISLKELEPAATKFLAGLDHDPLLRHNLWKQIQAGQTAKGILENVNGLVQKINFDINRIYRARNQVVHVGRTPSDLGEVVQRSHHYLDIVINMVEHLVGVDSGITTIEQANLEIGISFSDFKTILAEEAKQKSCCDSANYLRLHLGATL